MYRKTYPVHDVSSSSSDTAPALPLDLSATVSVSSEDSVVILDPAEDMEYGLEYVEYEDIPAPEVPEVTLDASGQFVVPEAPALSPIQPVPEVPGPAADPGVLLPGPILPPAYGPGDQGAPVYGPPHPGVMEADQLDQAQVTDLSCRLWTPARAPRNSPMSLPEYGPPLHAVVPGVPRWWPAISTPLGLVHNLQVCHQVFHPPSADYVSVILYISPSNIS